jgi:uncharacterized protein YtpQ (UPF0354 family)
VVREESAEFVVRVDGEEGVLNLHNLFGRLALEKSNTFEGRKPFYDDLVNSARELRQVAGPISLATHGDRVLPRISPARTFAGVAADLQPVSRPLPGTPLRVEYVIDNPHTIRYIDERTRADLGLDMDALHELALSNLRGKFSAQPVRLAVDDRTVARIATQDTYAAARLLLVPEHLKAGEAVVALIPDRDVLDIAPVPEDRDWSKLEALASVRGAPNPLLGRPLRVTRDGFEIV